MLYTRYDINMHYTVLYIGSNLIRMGRTSQLEAFFLGIVREISLWLPVRWGIRNVHQAWPQILFEE